MPRATSIMYNAKRTTPDIYERESPGEAGLVSVLHYETRVLTGRSPGVQSPRAPDLVVLPPAVPTPIRYR